MNRFEGLTIATEAKLLAITEGYFPDDRSDNKKSYCIHTDLKELKRHMERGSAFGEKNKT